MNADEAKTPSEHALSRRDFVAVGTAAGALLAASTQAQAADNGAPTLFPAPLDIAEWSFFWVGVERVDLARGAVVNGKQMYVEYQVPAQIRHPYPIVLVHGGGGQGLDWMGTPDGRPGWSTYLLQEGSAGGPFTPQTPWGLTDIPLAFAPPVSDAKELETVTVNPPEGSGIQPDKLQAEPTRKLKNLQGIPIAYVTAESSGRTQGLAVVAFLKQAGCNAVDFQLKDHGILGNGHFMMLESSRQVFDVIHGWIDENLRA